jgi:biopolymer transport protein ExbD/biopolymer transport protein TolR
MRRFSQRNSLVTLSDINITPLLDLAFVLLIIFVITTPLLEQGLNLKLPSGGSADKRIEKDDVRTVEVSSKGFYMLAGRVLSLDQVDADLKKAYRANRKLLVYIRADENVPYKSVAALLNRLEQSGIDQVSLRTEPTQK